VLHGQRGPYWIAEAYEYRGERDQAIDWLNQAYDRHDSQLVMLKDDPMLSGMRDDPQFKEFLRKMNCRSSDLPTVHRCNEIPSGSHSRPTAPGQDRQMAEASKISMLNSSCATGLRRNIGL
jgi:hypothetical protein